ncbi:signal peptidase I [Bacillus sp. FJAT-27225]|uniref:signal peptidase I SipW n=1 Tax=Bacillus sp. FJAT-27225 TaxID=1743144 RepID=UPI00080C205C|nr:signal peptidase I [Bacillus sp. FJAT-27225]OCA90840.1 signal peptidase I [Bacillus sp. FJAT-27225]
MKKDKKSSKKIWDLLYYSGFTVLLVLIAIVLWGRFTGGEPNLLGYQLKKVMSGSMEPTFSTGSLILVKKIENRSSLENGDIVSFIDNNSLTTHRILKVTNENGLLAFQTKGDNNAHPDMKPVYAGNVVAKYTGVTIPFLGYVLDFLGSNKGIGLLMIIPGILLVGYSILTIGSAIKDIDRRLKQAKGESKEAV